MYPTQDICMIEFSVDLSSFQHVITLNYQANKRWFYLFLSIYLFWAKRAVLCWRRQHAGMGGRRDADDDKICSDRKADTYHVLKSSQGTERQI